MLCVIYIIDMSNGNCFPPLSFSLKFSCNHTWSNRRLFLNFAWYVLCQFIFYLNPSLRNNFVVTGAGVKFCDAGRRNSWYGTIRWVWALVMLRFGTGQLAHWHVKYNICLSSQQSSSHCGRQANYNDWVTVQRYCKLLLLRESPSHIVT